MVLAIIEWRACTAVAAVLLAARAVPAQQPAGAAPPWLGFQVDSGPVVTIREVVPGSPAALARLARGDTVVSVAGRPASLAALREAVRDLHPPSMALPLELRRNGQTWRAVVRAEARVAVPRGPTPSTDVRQVHRTTLDYLAGAAQLVAVECAGVRSEARGGDSTAAGAPRTATMAIPRECFARADSAGAPALRLPGGGTVVRGSAPGGPLIGIALGLDLVTLTPGLAEYFPGAPRGALVVRVRPDSPAARAGVRDGDVVTHIGAAPVHDVRAASAALRALAAPAAITVVRRGTPRRITIAPPDPRR